MREKACVLLVDDEPNLLKMLVIRFELEGFETLTAMDGEEALKKARDEHPDLILLDLMLPKLDGYKVCTILKKDPQCQDIPIVMFTARAQQEDEKQGFACGADAYIRKPFNGTELISQIRRLLPGVKHPET